ncbi:monovalent cation:proton antiporter (CPA2 family) [Legionella lansingensis]|uniref:Monovalent cation:proton antiporter (CPA2 family) n=1 Tax=Legionella lansingensis TaxID=45067 RepID=A0A0W0VTJ7_9GAMM|nr:cation:proton antiporter [Legionella lansingensis]KTD23483.1 monovalent cation:proton antiporter (CPA2 family) [Legionella lansingensis]SNV50772.1 monovalent cation:proton antiporter (CPA2 family) [Legionella lansingensis]
MHSLPIITTLATALGLALIMGFIAVKLKLPALVGYLLAGVIIGPFTPGFVANVDIAAEFAEIGVMLLMFGVGLHFSLDNLLETRKIALPGALLQIIVATSLGTGVAIFWGWELSHALILGLALSVASTVVLIRALETQGLLGSTNGQIAVGWLIVEDIAMIIVLVFLPFMAQWFDGTSVENAGKNVWVLLGITLFKISSFIILMLLVGRWMLPKFLWQITRTGSRELFTLCVIAVSIGIAFGASKLFGISLALGAFFAGMIIRESKFSRRAAEESLPFRDAFAVLFFVSVGMLFNPHIFVEQPFRVLVVVGIIVVGKSIAAAMLVLAFRYPLNTALTVSASLAQIGEFSFILAGHGVQLKLLSGEGQGLILAGALISIAINPLIFKTIAPFQVWLRTRSSWVQIFERPEDPLAELPITTDEKYLSGHVVLIGYGQVGKRIGIILTEHGIPYVVIDQNRELVEQLRTDKMAAVFGSGSEPSALIQAHIARAGMLVVATSDAFDIRQMLNIAQKINSKIEVAIRVQNEEEEALLSQEIDGAFFLSEEELAKGISEYILNRFGMSTLKKKLKK